MQVKTLPDVISTVRQMLQPVALLPPGRCAASSWRDTCHTQLGVQSSAGARSLFG